MIAAITFDLWDTLVVDDSDETDRKALGLLPKPEARRAAFVAEIGRYHPDLATDVVEAAFEQANADFRHAWKVEHRTPPLADRLRDAYRHLGVEVTPGFWGLLHHLATMEVVHPPRPTDNVHACLEALHGRYPLGIVSDAIVTPGLQLRDLLAKHDLLKFFEHQVFSDEVGASKPDPLVFHAAAKGLGVPVEGILHVGDREANDIDGPIAAGAKSVLYTGAIDRGSDATRADIVCRDLADLPAQIAALA